MNLNNENYRYKELADFLKARRAKILPSQVGLLSTTRRRIPSLRRKEVAQLAGIGLTWHVGQPGHKNSKYLLNQFQICWL